MKKKIHSVMPKYAKVVEIYLISNGTKDVVSIVQLDISTSICFNFHEKVNLSDFISSTVCYEFKDYLGNDITSFKDIENPYECQKLCLGISECKFWSWIDTDPGAKQCWIKEYIINKNEYGSQGQSVISGPKTCGTM